ncbi:MAG: ribosomal L7Ae/L30e/S12e/Gadd45 family protein [Clostridia bacterium]|nr:ribosomal L7Ae/L30e/S12e/Gadd45 family protein [Clostridia bacterium]
MKTDEKIKFLNFLGLARRAGKTVHGMPLVCASLSARQPSLLVVASSEASDGTKKKITSQCTFYHVPLLFFPCSTDELAHAVGKTGNMATVGVTDERFAAQLTNIYEKGKETSARSEER